MSIEEIANEPLLAPEFSCHPQLIADYNAWLTGHGIAGGSHAEQIKGHARQYVQWKGMRMWEGPQSEPAQPYHRQSDDEDQYDLDNARRDFAGLVDRLNNIMNKLKTEDEIAEQYRTEYRNRREAWLANPRGPAPLQPRSKSSDYAATAQTKELLRLVLARQPIAPAATRLFDNYVHDSLAGFYLGTKTELNALALATTGYLRYRTVFKTEGPQAGPSGAAPAAAPAAQAGPKTAAATP